MKCWICELNEADSGEHSIKKSDLKTVFPSVSQEFPVRRKSHGRKDKLIGSVSSDNFKYEKVICNQCNNKGTQQFDKSWNILSSYLSSNWATIVENNGVHLSSVYSKNTEIELINVQLFFVKLLGCKVKETNMPFELKSFSDALMCHKEHPDIYISIRESGKTVSKKYAANADIVCFKNTAEKIQYLHWFYVICEFAVDVYYNEIPMDIELNGALKPSETEEFIKLANLTYDPTPGGDCQDRCRFFSSCFF